jgi:vacuolar-type H+-ATPase subunit H
MEELRSTEFLDREILEDARKKAFKILKTADDSVQSQARLWEKRLNKAVIGIRKNYEERFEKAASEIMAKGPLDRRRLRSEITGQFLNDAMNDFLRCLDRKKILGILDRELSSCLALCSVQDLNGRELLIKYSNMEKDEALSALQTAFGENGGFKNIDLTAQNLMPDKKNQASFPCLVLDMPGLKITASVDGAALNILGSSRAELTASLLGNGALND